MRLLCWLLTHRWFSFAQSDGSSVWMMRGCLRCGREEVAPWE
jgi:hypothetical protein